MKKSVFIFISSIFKFLKNQIHSAGGSEAVQRFYLSTYLTNSNLFIYSIYFWIYIPTSLIQRSTPGGDYLYSMGRTCH